MKIETHKLRFSFILLSLIIYNFFFWNEKFGINLPLFTTLLLVCQLVLNPVSVLSNRVRITIAGTLLSGLMVVLYDSFTGKFAHLSSFFLTTAFIHHIELRAVLYAIPTFVLDHFNVQHYLRIGNSSSLSPRNNTPCSRKSPLPPCARLHPTNHLTASALFCHICSIFGAV